MNFYDIVLYLFFIVGCMKFGLDCCFGMIKKLYKVIYVLFIFELVCLVENLSNIGINKV